MISHANVILKDLNFFRFQTCAYVIYATKHWVNLTRRILAVKAKNKANAAAESKNNMD